MIVLRKRLMFWLIKAYLKRWGRNILIYFGIGLVIFFFLNKTLSYFIARLPFMEKETIGIVGSYTVNSLPQEILGKISKGLTKTEIDGTVRPDIAEKWKIAPNGKSYAFILHKNIYFSDGTNLTSDDINYDFADVSVTRPDKYTIVFVLKDIYSPFLTTVSRPILKKGYVGVGDYKIKKLELSGNFIKSIELYSEKYHKILIYQLFYPTISALKIAFSLGEISRATNLPDLNFKNTTFNSFKNVKVEKKTDYTKLVTLFYNTKDKIVSSKILREGLSYTIPDSFEFGERNSTPLPDFSYANQAEQDTYQQDLEHAKLLIDKSETATGSGKIFLTIDTLAKYESVAKIIANNWKKLDIETKIRVVNQIPSSFQIFLGEFNISSDPDQYVLWHSSQINNITHYSNARIDKLLEDGRKELDTQKRILIYTDFQKYLLSDPPASFLFFPYYYEVSKK
ncbi:MAG: ABC transporter substrate-binding protein [Candidatus Levybacteria bacterium]|nr:ABC transporter substrate-binding protein [Candidatus Levybacteria bacterium]